MTAERWQLISNTFEAALDLPPHARQAFLEHTCPGDSELHSEVARLISELERAGDFLETPVATPNQSLNPGQIIAGRYRIEALLGRGGMGEVYRAMDTLINEEVALKILRPELSGDESVVRRFQREVQLARKVSHPNVCRVYEVGVDAGSAGPLHFFTMQLIDGETLAARIRREGAMRKDKAYPLIRQIAEGLGAAHAAGVIHRDFKSSNIILATCADGPPTPIITDFGLARFEAPQGEQQSEHTITINRQLAGTVAYMSPEQLFGGEVTAASDIYSFGIVLYEMATGALPFDDRDPIKAALERTRPAPDPRVKNMSVEPQWAAAIARCLEPKPDRRFAGAQEISAHFKPAWRPPTAYWTRRQWGKAAAAAGAAITVGSVAWYETHRPYQPKPGAITWVEKGRASLWSETFESARRALEQAISIDPMYALAHAFLSIALGELDFSELASEAANRASSLAEQFHLSAEDKLWVVAARHFVNHDYKLAQAALRELPAYAKDLSTRSRTHVELARFESREDFENALAHAQQAVSEDPGFSGARLLLAQLLARKRDDAAAGQQFIQAEGLFAAASDYDGLLETVVVRSVFLSRTGRSAEGAAVARQAMPMAESTKDTLHLLRLQLALSLAQRNMGQMAEARRLSEETIAAAKSQGHSVLAASALTDLGSTSLAQGEPAVAERCFREAIDVSARAKATFNEARARLSLGSFFVQYGRFTEANEHVELALGAFRKGKYRRETTQGLILQGDLQRNQCQYERAVATLRESLDLAKKMADAAVVGTATTHLAELLFTIGAWSEAAGFQRGVLADRPKPGAPRCRALAGLGRTLANIGFHHEAEKLLNEAEAILASLSGEQADLRFTIALSRAEAEFIQRRWREAGQIAQGQSASLSPECFAIDALCSFRLMRETGRIDTAIALLHTRGLTFAAYQTELRYAETLAEAGKVDQAANLAGRISSFFLEHGLWEMAWRTLALSPDSGGRQRAVRERMRGAKVLEAAHFEAYMRRPDIAVLAL